MGPFQVRNLLEIKVENVQLCHVIMKMDVKENGFKNKFRPENWGVERSVICSSALESNRRAVNYREQTMPNTFVFVRLSRALFTLGSTRVPTRKKIVLLSTTFSAQHSLTQILWWRPEGFNSDSWPQSKMGRAPIECFLKSHSCCYSHRWWAVPLSYLKPHAHCNSFISLAILWLSDRQGESDGSRHVWHDTKDVHL